MKFFVTTPIYYVNDQPHIGHAYSTVAADILARFHRMMGHRVFFLTGTDEHGQKVQRAAELKGRGPKEHADLMVKNYKDLWATLGVQPDAFIRTTDRGHKVVVQELLQRLWDKGEIERRTYSGWYCTPDERFWTEKDLQEGKCPECGREVERIEEDNYFFLMSRYRDRLVRHIEENPSYILPETRRNEVLGFLRSQTLGDLCISRPARRLSWGIPLPFDPEFVTYVWFDALVNYYSATRYLVFPPLAPSDRPFETGDFEPWPANHHIIGKDILTTHAVYWSTMLMALGMPLPANIFAHGWWTVEGRKMSKSLGNVVDPVEMAGRYGADALRYFLFREVTFGLDGDFSEEALVGRLNTELANDFGNLSSRVHKMLANYFASEVPAPEAPEAEIRDLAEGILGALERHLAGLQFQKALEEVWKLVSAVNKYIDSNAPWALAKDPSMRPRLATVLYTSAEALRFLCLYLYPFMPESSEKLWQSLGLAPNLSPPPLPEEARWGRLRPGTRLGELKPLFPRIIKPGKAAPPPAAAKPEAAGERPSPKEGKPAADEKKKPAAEEAGLIGIEDFARAELRAARVLSAERVKGSKKLIRLEVDAGEPRQVVAGIGEHYAPEDLVGRDIVVVANLKPARLMGVESRGMLLAATDAGDGRLSILTLDRPVKPGSRIK
ncbi:MAG: methionine--tRNA ligase [Thermodesulfovibrionales bacterium]